MPNPSVVPASMARAKYLEKYYGPEAINKRIEKAIEDHKTYFVISSNNMGKEEWEALKKMLEGLNYEVVKDTSHGINAYRVRF